MKIATLLNKRNPTNTYARKLEKELKHGKKIDKNISMDKSIKSKSSMRYTITIRMTVGGRKSTLAAKLKLTVKKNVYKSGKSIL